MQLDWIDVVDHDMEWFLVYMSLFSAFGMVAPLLVANLIPILKQKITEQVLGLIEILGGAAIVSSWIGAFGLYRDGIGYDTFVHFFASWCLLIIFGLVLTTALQYQHWWLILGMAAILTLLGGLLNELFEYAGDQLFSTMMYGEAGQPDDTLRDLIADGVGVMVGAGIFYFLRLRIRKYIS